MLACEARGTVFVDDELQGFVEPAVLPVAVPVGVGAIFEGDGGCIVEADDEGGGFYGVEGGSVRGRGVA